MDITKLLVPRTICVVGASEKEGFGGDTCRNIVKYMDLSRVFFVNPKRDSVFGVPCYQTIDAVPESFDLVIICTPKSTVHDLLRQAHLKGARACVLYASGYSEVGTVECRRDEEELQHLCIKLDIALMGPNCAGFINFNDQVQAFAFISEERDRRGSVGLISQSGQLCASLMDSPNMKFSYAISSGNSSIITMEDYLEFLVNDNGTKVVALYLEGVKKPEQFAASLRKAAVKRKPIVVLKAGRSAKSRQIASSHTGSLAGSDEVYDALFRKFGVVRVSDMEELLATSLLFSVLPQLPDKSTVASINFSGGETGICADLGFIYGIDFPDFSDSTLNKLKEMLPFYATPNNPLDMTASLSNDTDGYAGVLRTVMDDENVGLIAIGYTLLLQIVDPCIHYMCAGIEKVVKERAASGCLKPMVMIPFIENTRNYEYMETLEQLGITILPSSDYAFRILKYLMDFVKYDYSQVDSTLSIPSKPPAQGTKALTEHQSKKLLAKYGIHTPPEKVCTSKEAAVDFASECGYPVVAKIDSSDILHKSDIGGVKVNLKTAQEVEKAFDAIMDNAKSHMPHAHIGGILVQKMADAGLEVIVGVNNDAQFGPAVLCGLGGVFVEIFQDTSLCLAPVSKAEALSMVNSLQSAKLLQGYRGKPKLDSDSLADIIVNIAKFASDHKDTLQELDINPLFVYKNGVCAVDALIINRADNNLKQGAD